MLQRSALILFFRQWLYKKIKHCAYFLTAPVVGADLDSAKSVI